MFNVDDPLSIGEKETMSCLDTNSPLSNKTYMGSIKEILYELECANRKY